MLERQKCERRGREIRRNWWERGKMRGRVVRERNAGDKEGRRGKRKTEEKRDRIYQHLVQHNTEVDMKNLFLVCLWLTGRLLNWMLRARSCTGALFSERSPTFLTREFGKKTNFS